MINFQEKNIGELKIVSDKVLEKMDKLLRGDDACGINMYVELAEIEKLK